MGARKRKYSHKASGVSSPGTAATLLSSAAETSISAIVALSALSEFSVDSSFLWKVCDSERLTARKLFGSLTLSTVSSLFFACPSMLTTSEGEEILVELRSQRINDLFPILMCRQAASRRTGNTVFAIKLHIQWVESMSARTDRNPNRIRVLRYLIGMRIGRCFVFGFVQLEADLG